MVPSMSGPGVEGLGGTDRQPCVCSGLTGSLGTSRTGQVYICIFVGMRSPRAGAGWTLSPWRHSALREVVVTLPSASSDLCVHPPCGLGLGLGLVRVRPSLYQSIFSHVLIFLLVFLFS